MSSLNSSPACLPNRHLPIILALFLGCCLAACTTTTPLLPTASPTLAPSATATPLPSPTITATPAPTATPIPAPYRIEEGQLQTWNEATSQYSPVEATEGQTVVVDTVIQVNGIWLALADGALVAYSTEAGELLIADEQGVVTWADETRWQWDATLGELVEARPELTWEGGVLARYNQTSSEYEPLMAAEEVNLDDRYAKMAPVFSRYNGTEELTGFDEAELALRRAEQVFRLYSQEAGQDKVEWLNEAEFVTQMEEYLSGQPELEVIQRQSPDGSQLITLIYNQENNTVYWAGRPDGTLAYMEPNRYTVETDLVEVKLPEGLRPEVRFNQLNGYWFVFGVDEAGAARYYFDSFGAVAQGKEQWIEMFQGNYSKEYEPSFTEDFVYVDPESGLELEIGLGITNDLPVTAFEHNDPGREMAGKLWLAACYYRYTEVMGHKDVTMEAYLELVKQGQGQIELWLFDELSGNQKKVLVDPRDGVTVTVTGRSDLPLKASVVNAKYPFHQYITVNADGRVMVVMEYNLKALKDDYQTVVVEKKWPADLFYANGIDAYMWGGLFYLAMLKPENFERGGVQAEQPDGVLQETLNNCWVPYANMNVFKDPYPFVTTITYR